MRRFKGFNGDGSKGFYREQYLFASESAKHMEVRNCSSYLLFRGGVTDLLAPRPP